MKHFIIIVFAMSQLQMMQSDINKAPVNAHCMLQNYYYALSEIHPQWASFYRIKTQVELDQCLGQSR